MHQFYVYIIIFVPFCRFAVISCSNVSERMKCLAEEIEMVSAVVHVVTESPLRGSPFVQRL